jgi:tetratricopeptide (TPR) repeat protein
METCDPKQKNAAGLIGQLAQWVDIGFAQPDLVRNVLARFPADLRASLPVCDFAQLQLAEGFVTMSEQREEKAIQHFQVVLAIEGQIRDQDLFAVANFWIGRCYRRMSRYRDALGYVVKAREAAAKLKHFETVAVIQVLEGWLLFQEGETNNASRILGEAEGLLLGTDDFIARGNLNATYSRIARRTGDWDEALRRSEMAIRDFKKRDGHHRNLARSLVNNAFVKRLLAMELSEKIDSKAARARGTSETKQPAVEFESQRSRAQVKVLRTEAIQDLTEAAAIYSRCHDYRGEGEVQITHGYLHLDDGDLDLATARAVGAYKLGEQREDAVLMARPRLLQSAVETAKVEEQIVEGAGTGRSARLACEYAREALDYAKETQNRQLIMEALFTLGVALLNDGEIDDARACCDQATAMLTPDNRDYGWRQLQGLRSKLNAVGNVDGILREWSRGVVGKKTFQQITEEFAAIVIPKVWRQEGCMVSRVAKRLSISPKKVRRILRDQGLFSGRD